ncbi:hypothetical protein L1280_002002 [Deinococcus sp. HSC-46F16]|uniref:hypothetical protein n=1 Tax=Deinococcus sp. HSC-46F16 TaxID=2910968 RepID=UPI0020A148E5|nr:hypothetical protein [Deinococcus sp. HSC-46F16]MCP2014850.1 hypothetical protein [Deinococcus sp. HSC-46F16]
MSDDKPHPAADRSPQGGAKDTDDLSGEKAVRRPGMAEKGQQVEQTPKDVTGEHDALTPQRRLP